MLPGRRDSWQRDPRAGVLVLTAGLLVAGFIALGIGLLVAPGFIALDQAVSAWFRAIRVPGIEPLAIVASRLGDTGPMTLLTAATAVVLWFRGRRVEAVMIIVAVLGAAILGNGLKLVFHRMRPALEYARIALPESYSFPSGHAIASFSYFAMLAFVLVVNTPRLKFDALITAGCLAVSAAVALSRVFLGVHYFGDILGAWLLGAAWIAGVIAVAARWGAGPQSGGTTELGGVSV
jgi:undecaprenyl-diphosphatase